MATVAAHYQDLLDQDYARLSSTLSFEKSQNPIKFISTVTNSEIDVSTGLPSEYWVANLVSPVLFNTGLKRLLSDMGESPVLLEVGPHAGLGGPIRQICSSVGRPCNYISVQKRKTNCEVAFLSALGKLYQEGAPIDFDKLFATKGGRAVSGLPTYAWDYAKLAQLHDSRMANSWRERKYPHHCLLGVRTEESTGSALRWRNILHLDNVDWLKDHQVSGNIVLPFAGYMAMAGEAVRQASDQDLGCGYHCHNVNAGVALILGDAHMRSVEIVTTIVKKSSTGTTADSDAGWYSFMIESYNGVSWTQNCTGEVRQAQPSAEDHCPELPAKNLTRQVAPPQFYASLRNIGLEYTRDFAALRDLSFSTGTHLAKATMPDPARADGASSPLFTMHPATIDSCLQLFLCTEEKGLMRNVNLCVPAVVEDFIVWPHREASSTVSLSAAITADENGVKRSIVTVKDGAQAVATMTGIQLKPLEDRGDKIASTQGGHGAASLVWLPDFDFTDVSKLIRTPPSNRKNTQLLQELAFLCILETRLAVDGLPPVQPHFGRFRNWLLMEIEKARAGNSPLISTAGRLIAMPSAERLQLIDRHLDALRGTPQGAAAVGMRRLVRQAGAVFQGNAEALEILTEDKVLTEIYNASAFDYGDFVRCLSHTRPTLRILEVGAGTGGTSQLIFDGLSTDGGAGRADLPPFDLYTFTDISSGFFPDAKERFSHVRNIEYKIFDINKTPQEQGFEDARLGSYDLIVATQVIHAVPNIGTALKNIRLLLKDEGILLITEPDPQSLSTSFISGHLPGWWLGQEDHRRNGPLISTDRWDAELKSSGFTGAPQPLFDDAPPYHRGFAIVARPDKFTPMTTRGSISLYRSGLEETSAHAEVEKSLVGLGWDLAPLELTYPPSAPSDSIILHVTGSTSHEAACSFDESSFAGLKSLLQSITQQHKVLWVLPRTQIQCSDSSGAYLLGVARGLRSEMSLQLFTLEINADEPDYVAVVDKVLRKVNISESSTQLAADMEFVYYDGEICVGRFHPVGFEGSSIAGSIPSSPAETTHSTESNDELAEVSSQSSAASSSSTQIGQISFNPDATYLLVGGVRGLGRSIATWLVTRGARHLILFSRSVGTDAESLAFTRQLESMGCAISVVAGSVESMDDVQRAVAAAASRPIRGVFQLAMVLNDATMADMSWQQWGDPLRPKVDGTWNLHRALLGHDLDVFWMASSVITAFDMPGQSNYQAANVFLQAFCQYRHSLGLPASVLDISAINDVGYVSANAEAVRQIRGFGLMFDGEREFIDCLELSLLSSEWNMRVDVHTTTHADGSPASKKGRLQPLKPWVNHSHITMGVKSEKHLDDPRCTTSWRRNPKMGFYHNDKPEAAGGQDGDADSNLSDLLRRVAEPGSGRALLGDEGTADALAHEIGQKIQDLMMRPKDEQVDVGDSLAEIGLDSLMAIQLRRWFKAVLGVQLSVLEIMATASLRQLGALTATKLIDHLHSSGGKD